MKKIGLRKVILWGGVFVIICNIIFNHSITSITSIENSGKLGIIDENLSLEYEDLIVLNPVEEIKGNTLTHGDKMVEFAQEYAPNQEIYYYSASDREGIVTTDRIIKGLEMMKKEGIKVINISMSSDIYSAEFEQYILGNQKQMQIYASYSNVTESLDYPAMYKGVIGVGKKIVYSKTSYINA